MPSVCGVGSHSHKDRGDDFYPTPREAVLGLLAAEGGLIPKGLIWEPACGDGAIVNVLRECGHSVTASDIIDRGCPGAGTLDFLSSKGNWQANAIITNPPFKLAREFVDRALEYSPYVAFLLRLAFLEGAARKPWFENGPLARVHVSSRRLPMMHRNGWTGPKSTSAVCHAWFVWDKRYADGHPVIKWFDFKAANDNVPVNAKAA